MESTGFLETITQSYDSALVEFGVDSELSLVCSTAFLSKLKSELDLAGEGYVSATYNNGNLASILGCPIECFPNPNGVIACTFALSCIEERVKREYIECFSNPD